MEKKKWRKWQPQEENDTQNKRNPWREFPKKRPPLFELCKCVNADGEFRYGWWNGDFWEYGIKSLPGIVIKWRFAKEDFYKNLRGKKLAKKWP